MSANAKRPAFKAGAAIAALALAWVFAAQTSIAATAQAGAVATQAQSAEAEKKPVRTIREWNLPKADRAGKRLAIKGYDPVAYFPEGGGKATKGKKDYELVHEGVTYRFANARNRDRFKHNPTRYEPAHGGWCSYAMITGDKTAPNPKTFIVKDDRLFLFYNALLGNTKKSWLKGDHDQQAGRADTRWERIAKEKPRAVAALKNDK